MINRVKVLLMIFATFCMRPAIFGSFFQTGTLILAVVLLVVHRLETTESDPKLAMQSRVVLASVGMLWLYFAVHGFLAGGVDAEALTKGFYTNMTILACWSFMLSDPLTNRRYFRGIFFLFLFEVASYVVTTAISLVVPIRSIPHFHIPLGYTTPTAGDTYFPFTVIYDYTTRGIKVARLLSFTREAGISQAIYAFIFFGLPAVGMHKKWQRALALLGIAACFSTTGLVSFFASLTVFLGFGNRRPSARFVAPIVMVLGALVVYFTPSFGLKARAENVYAKSYASRSAATSTAVDKFMTNPVGTGYPTTEYGFENEGVSLIASMHQVGVFGLFFIFAAWVVPALATREKALFVACMVPLFVTMFVAQPIFATPFVYLFMMMDFSGARKAFLSVEQQRELHERRDLPLDPARRLAGRGIG